MDKTTNQLLYLLNYSMHGGTIEQVDLSDADWKGIFELAGIHQIIPMIYDALAKMHALSLLPEELVYSWQDMYLGFSINQLRRTMEFIKLYSRLLQAGIMALVVKGLVCRQLYPDAYYRSSCDEDVLIRGEDFEAADRLLIASGLVRIEHRRMGTQYEITYKSPESGLYIELHTSLFRPESKYFSRWNALFRNIFQAPLPLSIEGITVYTLSEEQHLLFLVLHAVKHFITNGLGIRQLCDIVMYCNSYGNRISWEHLWQVMAELGYSVWLFNLLDIGAHYLGLREEMLQYPPDRAAREPHSRALLEDLMKAGVFGRAASGQEKSGLVTMQSILNARRITLWQAVFPCYEYMKGHYAYCEKHLFLLPAAWFHRLLVYAAAEKSPVKMFFKARRIFIVGRKRIKLLDEYRILET